VVERASRAGNLRSNPYNYFIICTCFQNKHVKGFVDRCFGLSVFVRNPTKFCKVCSRADHFRNVRCRFGLKYVTKKN